MLTYADSMLERMAGASLTLDGVRVRMLTYADVCLRMLERMAGASLTLDGVRVRMLTYADVC
jgi:hypothetical protein